MNQPLVRLVAASGVVCLATWLALLAAGNVGLQRSISRGAQTLFEQPLVVALVAATAFVVAYVMANRLGVSAGSLLVGILVGDAIAGLVLAPLLIGELEPIHAPLVVAAISVLGVQPAAAVAGAHFGQRRTVPAK